MTRVDVHTHLAPLLNPRTLDAITDADRDPSDRLRVDGHPTGPPSIKDPAALINYLDRAGLDEAIVAIPPPFFRQHLSTRDCGPWVGAVNDGIAARVADQPRLRALAYLPLEHPDLALSEYDTVRRDGRFVGVTAAAGGSSVPLSDPALEPLWRALDRDQATLLLHPGTAPDPRLARYYLTNLLGNPSETTIAAAHLVFGGVLTRYPRLRVVLVHCGGTLPSVVGRWQRGVDTGRPGTVDVPEAPVDAVRRLYVDCLAHDPAVVDLAVSTFGADKILLGSDWPYPMGSDDPVGLIAHRGPGFVEAAAAANPATLFTELPAALTRNSADRG